MSQGSSLFKMTSGNFSYGDSAIFNDLNFSLKKKKFYGLIGPNGSGKSTLINLLMAISKLQSGTLLFKEAALHNYSRRTIARHLALVPQNITLGFDFNVQDIVMMGRHPHIPRFSHPSSVDEDIVEKAINLLDINHLTDKPVTHLSGGEKQRVVIARALAQDTEVLILDEATSSLDIEHSLEIMRILRGLVSKKGTTVIAAIHDLNLAAAFCDELIVLHNHTIHALGSVASILTSPLLKDVFSVDATVSLSHNLNYPRIEYDMHG